MKRLTQIGKVSILTFCLLIFSLNFHQVLRADWPDCDEAQAPKCFMEAVDDCNGLCQLLRDSTCDYVVWLSGYCDEGLCMQMFELWCVNGYLGEYEFECYLANCPW